MVEVIMTIAILGIVISPLISIFILSQKINNTSELEYKTMLFAQNYMEEVQELNEIDSDIYEYINDTNSFERLIYEDDVVTKIVLKPCNDIIYDIEIEVSQNGKVLNTLSGSKIIN